MQLRIKKGEVEDPKNPGDRFGNWTGDNDTKTQAADLMKRGLIGAEQILFTNPNVTTREGIVHSQADWKPAAISQILQNAYRLGIRKPEEVMANKDILIGNSDFRKAINDPIFNNIHPNFWQVITHSLLPEQWAKYDAQNKMIAKK